VYARIKSRLSFHDLFFEIPLLDINWTIEKLHPDLQLFEEMNLTSLGCRRRITTLLSHSSMLLLHWSSFDDHDMTHTLAAKV
jgi:hypothetical protein